MCLNKLSIQLLSIDWSPRGICSFVRPVAIVPFGQKLKTQQCRTSKEIHLKLQPIFGSTVASSSEIYARKTNHALHMPDSIRITRRESLTYILLT